MKITFQQRLSFTFADLVGFFVFFSWSRWHFGRKKFLYKRYLVKVRIVLLKTPLGRLVFVTKRTSSGRQEIKFLFWKIKTHYYSFYNPPLDHILSQVVIQSKTTQPITLTFFLILSSRLDLHFANGLSFSRFRLAFCAFLISFLGVMSSVFPFFYSEFNILILFG